MRPGAGSLIKKGEPTPQQNNSDLQQHISEATINSLDFSRLVIQLQSVLDFSKEVDTADTLSLLRNFEQALGKNSNLNHSMFTVQLFQDLFG